MRTALVVAYFGVGFTGILGACGGSVSESTANGGTSSTTIGATGTGGVASTTGTGITTTGTGMGGVNVSTTGAGAGPGTTDVGVGPSTTVGDATTGVGTSTAATSGTGGGNPGCPAATPANMTACMGMQGDVCDYGTTECSCAGPAGMGGPTWRCHTCPATLPAVGTSCMGQQGATCTYGMTDCSCPMGGDWVCGTCPATEPTNNSMCPTADIYCGYAGTSCLCTPGMGPMMGNRWHCNAPCPAQQPNPGDACSTPPNSQCTYGMSTCLCVQGQFFCN